jgi:hypothetical protein
VELETAMGDVQGGVDNMIGSIGQLADSVSAITRRGAGRPT